MATQAQTFGLSDLFARVYDVARGTFDAVADFDLARAELEIERDRQRADAATLNPMVTTASEAGGVVSGSPAMLGGMDLQTLLLIGGGAVLVLLLLFRR